MEATAVRVRLPGGETFTAAFVEAVQKYALRRGFSGEGTERFVAVLEPSVMAVSSSSPAAVELIVADEGGAIRTELHGIEPSHAVTGAAREAIDRAVADIAEVEAVTVDLDGAIVRFTIVID